jgi:hypothetical protein
MIKWLAGIVATIVSGVLVATIVANLQDHHGSNPPPTSGPTHVTESTSTPTPPLSITASVDKPNVNAVCPQVITFTAVVRYTASAPVRVQYQWLRSDGAIDTNQTFVSFSGPGTQSVTTRWTLGAATPPFQPFHGWEQLELLTTRVALSNQANFTLFCQAPIT